MNFRLSEVVKNVEDKVINAMENIKSKTFKHSIAKSVSKMESIIDISELHYLLKVYHGYQCMSTEAMLREDFAKYKHFLELAILQEVQIDKLTIDTTFERQGQKDFVCEAFEWKHQMLLLKETPEMLKRLAKHYIKYPNTLEIGVILEEKICHNQYISTIKPQTSTALACV